MSLEQHKQFANEFIKNSKCLLQSFTHAVKILLKFLRATACNASRVLAIVCNFANKIDRFNIKILFFVTFLFTALYMKLKKTMALAIETSNTLVQRLSIKDV